MYDPLPYLVKPYVREPYGPIRLGLALHLLKLKAKALI